jgi:hypothetical protein
MNYIINTYIFSKVMKAFMVRITTINYKLLFVIYKLANFITKILDIERNGISIGALFSLGTFWHICILYFFQ